MLQNKRGEMGIGTLIIFIAMILVAAIAAGVLIRTATGLQSRALLTGERSKEQVSTNTQTLILYATNGSNHSVIDFEQRIKLAPGSSPVKFGQASIEFDTNDKSASLQYLDGSCIRNTGRNATGAWVGYDNSSAVGYGGYYTNGTSATGYFTVEYLNNGSLSEKGYLHRGDLVRLCYQAPREIQEDETIIITFIPQIGNPMEIYTATPYIMATDKVIVFP